MDFKEQLAIILKEHNIANALELLEVPPNPELGDYALPCFTFAKELKKAPPMIAQDLANKITEKNINFIKDVKALGPYVNITIKPTALIKEAFAEHKIPPNNKVMVIDYSSPNIAKPFGIGHLRSTVIGGALKRIYTYNGWKVVGINYIGDWGTQFGKLICAYKKWPVDITDEPIKKLLSIYVKFHEEAKNDPTLDDQAREEFKKLEDGDKENLALWEQFRELSLIEFNKLYTRMHISFDSTAGEAFYNDKMDSAIELLKEKGLLEESEGAQIVNLSDEGIETPPMLLKSNGTTSYITRDLAAILYRKEHYKFDKALYEIGSEQQLHLKQLFAIVKKLGHEWYKNCVHVNHGLYRFEEGKMSTRKGQVIFIEDVFAQAKEKTLATIEAKNPDLKNKEEIAEAVALGAIVFNDLKNDRVLDIQFDWDEILNFEGESGPYLIYTHARLRSILRKSDVKPLADYELLADENAVAIARHLLQFNNTIAQIIESNKPHTLARYLLELAKLMNSYYQHHRVIQDNKMLEQARLALIEKVADQLKIGLELLGITALEEM